MYYQNTSQDSLLLRVSLIGENVRLNLKGAGISTLLFAVQVLGSFKCLVKGKLC